MLGRSQNIILHTSRLRNFFASLTFRNIQEIFLERCLEICLIWQSWWLWWWMMMMQMERSKSFELYDDEYEKIMNMREKGAKVLGYMLARCLGRSHNMTLHTPDYQKNCILGIIIMIMYKRKLWIWERKGVKVLGYMLHSQMSGEERSDGAWISAHLHICACMYLYLSIF